MDLMKYIISDCGAPLLFSKEILHNQVLQSGRSAGFLFLKFDLANRKVKAHCFGRSTTLNLTASAREDQVIIEAFLNK